MTESVEKTQQPVEAKSPSLGGSAAAVGVFSGYFLIFGPPSGFGWMVSLGVGIALLILAVFLGVPAYKDYQKKQQG